MPPSKTLVHFYLYQILDGEHMEISADIIEAENE